MEREVLAVAIMDQLSREYWRQPDGAAPRGDDRSFRAWEGVQALLRIDGIAGSVVALLATTATTDPRRAYLAAGPLEEVLNAAQPHDLEVLEGALTHSPHLVDCMYRINGPDDATAASWLERQRARHPRASGGSRESHA